MVLDREALTKAERQRLDRLVQAGPYTEADIAAFLLSYDEVEVAYVLELLEANSGV
jgi:hypothetical protein